MTTADIDPLVSIRDVCAITRLSRASIYRLIRRDEFPTPKRITPGCVRWQLSAIQGWMDDLPQRTE